MKSLVKAFGLIAGLAISGAACAVGMGGISVSSSLGEPLKAEIELVAVGKAEKSSLVARLASPEMFKGAGMDYPANLPKLKFQIETRANGESYLGLTSAQPVNEPFISVLIELGWSSGKLLREYTFLLDPPEFSAKQPEASEVKPVLSKAAGVPAMQMRATAPLDEKAFAEAPPVPARAAKSAAAPTAANATASSNVATGTIKVKRGDTLSQLALDTKPSGISLERMLLALYRANGEAFDGSNMNRLKTGRILRLPEQTDLSKITQVEAAGEFRAHTADWNAYRQKLAAASATGTGTDQASKQEVAGKISAAIADKSPAAQESAKEVVRLSKGEAPGDKAVVNGNAKAMQEKIHTLEEEATARNKALKESNERVVALEKNIKEMQRLIELKSQPALPAQGKAVPPAETKAATKPEAKPEQPVVEAKPAAAASQPAAPPVAAVAASAPAGTAKPGKPAEKPVAPKVEPPPPSLLDDPIYLAAGAAALLALGGLGFALSRRGKGAKPAKKAIPEGGGEAPVDVGSATGRIIAPPAPSPETGDFTQSATVAPVSPAQADVDPLSEAELFLTFGRDAQAEEILKDALEKNPANNLVRLKLLSVYANRKDTNSFSVIARQVEASGDAAAWAQAAEMGRSLEPGNPMYGAVGEPVVAAEAGLGKSEPPPAAGLDFDLGFGAPETAAAADNGGGPAVEQPDNETSAGLDFDLSAGEPDATTPSEYTSTLVLKPAAAKLAADNSSEITLINTQEDLRAAQGAPMDFDVSGGFAAQTAEPEKPNLDDLVFDITASQPSPVAMEEGAEAGNATAGAEDKTVAFALDFPTEPAQAGAGAAVDFDLGSISLDMEAPAPAAQAPVAEVRDAHWHDVATKLDLAKAYQEMGDNAGAREILEEVMAEGDEQQRAAAEAIKQQLLA